MPMKRCLGCDKLTAGSRCKRCRKAQKAEYVTAEYKTAREAVLVRDGWKCQKMRNGRRCLRFATTADHIVPVSKGGRSTMDNMEAACRPCNSGKRDR